MEIKNGVIGFESPNDFLVGAIDNIPELENQDSIIFEYNQGRSTKCSIYASMGAVSDLMNYKFTLQDQADIRALAKSMGYVEGNGRWAYMAVDCIRNRWNKKFPDKKIISLLVDCNSPKFYEALEKGYSLVTGYNGDSTYNKDMLDDGIVQGTSFGNTYGHLVRKSKYGNIGKGITTYVIDNYLGRDYNIYGLEKPKELIDNNVFFKNAYIFIPEKKLEKSKQQIKVESQMQMIKKANSILRNEIDILQRENIGNTVWKDYQSVKENLHGVNISIANILH